MNGWTQWILASVAAVMLIVQGCETTGPAREVHWVPVAISTISDVVGTWEGLMTRSPHRTRARDEDWLRVSIGEDSILQFASYRTIGVFSGTGRLVLEDGKLVADSERGRVACALYAAGVQRMLKVTGTARDGLEYSAELTPAR